MLQSEPRRCHTASSNWLRIMRNQEKVLDVRAHLADRLLIRPPAVFDEIKERRYRWPVALFEEVQEVGLAEARPAREPHALILKVLREGVGNERSVEFIARDEVSS